MTTRHATPEQVLNINLLGRGQRTTEDVLLHVTLANGTDVTEYAPPGMAEYLLTRYAASTYATVTKIEELP